MTFIVETRSFCGMTLPHGEFDTVHAARHRVAQRLRFLRDEGFLVTTLDDDTWEVLEPDHALGISDYCGLIVIKRVEDEVFDEDTDEYTED